MNLIVGLGNPGTRYQLTRHNVGFRVIDLLAQEAEVRVDWKNKFNAMFFRYLIGNEPIILFKPQTYMNLSGQAVGEIIRYFDISCQDILVIYDDIDLPLGQLRIRRKGSSGGHRGIESIIANVGTEDIPRLRIGIRNERLLQKMDYPSFVLSRFLPEEIKKIEKALQKAVQAIHVILNQGYSDAMQQTNNTSDHLT